MGGDYNIRPRRPSPIWIRTEMPAFQALTATGTDELPLLVGVSRKSMLGTITGRPVDQRVAASVAAALLGVLKGAKILRVHDVAETKDALAVLAAIEQGVCNE